MFDTISEVETFYKAGVEGRHKTIYTTFESNLPAEVRVAFNEGDGFGEEAFCWNWQLLVAAMPESFKFLEIGVYKGRVMALIDILSRRMNKNAALYGVTPLSDTGDKFSRYPKEDYAFAIESNFNKMGAKLDNLSIIKGFSTDERILGIAKSYAQYDIIFIDGCHDYEVVCDDIKNYVPMLKSGGYLVMDDASLFLENPFGRFIGHDDVCRAIRDNVDSNTELTHILAVGHNRVWRKN